MLNPCLQYTYNNNNNNNNNYNYNYNYNIKKAFSERGRKTFGSSSFHVRYKDFEKWISEN